MVLPADGRLYHLQSRTGAVSILLRAAPGQPPAKQGAIGILERLLERVRGSFPKARVLVRLDLDGGFAGPKMLDFLEQSQVDYIACRRSWTRAGTGDGEVFLERGDAHVEH